MSTEKAEKLRALIERDQAKKKQLKGESEQARIKRELLEVSDLLLDMLTGGYSGEMIFQRVNDAGIAIKQKSTLLNHLKKMFPCEYEKHLSRKRR